MTTYYIKITEEEPLESEKALWFELETDANGKAEFFVLDRNDYNELVGEFNSVKKNFQEDIVEPLVEEVLESGDIPHATMSDYIANPNNQNQKYSYSQLVSTFNTKADKTTVASLQESKADNQTVTSLQNTISQKAPLTHSHSTWTWKDLSSYYGVYVNEELRLCQFSYYNQNVSMTSGKLYEYNLDNLGNYKPKLNTKLTTLHSQQVAQLTTDGILKFSSLQGGKQNMYFGAMYVY